MCHALLCNIATSSRAPGNDDVRLLKCNVIPYASARLICLDNKRSDLSQALSSLLFRTFDRASIGLFFMLIAYI